MLRVISNCPLKGAFIYLFYNYRSALELNSYNCTIQLSMPLQLSDLTLC